MRKIFQTNKRYRTKREIKRERERGGDGQEEEVRNKGYKEKGSGGRRGGGVVMSVMLKIEGQGNRP